MPVGILEIKLGACLNAPTRVLHQWLRESARDCCRAKNAAYRCWARWREDHPDWTPQPRLADDGTPRVNAKGAPVLESPFAPDKIQTKTGPKDMQTAMYHAARDAAPRLSSKIATGCSGDVKSYLTGNMPYNYEGPEQYRWQAILSYAINPPSFRESIIYVPSQGSAICYQGLLSNPAPGQKRGWRQELAQIGRSSCVIRFPLFSDAAKEEGQRVLAPIVRLKIGRLTRGNRRILRRLASPSSEDGLQVKDSKLVYKDRGRKSACGWYLQISYDVPAKDWGLDKSRVATLTPSHAGSKWPFQLQFPDGRTWGIGDGIPLEREFNRLQSRRRMLRHRYKHGMAKGRGRRHFFRKAIGKDSRGFVDMQSTFIDYAVHDVIKQLIREDCGKLVYREPSMPLREMLWFANRGVPFNWTDFYGQLKFQLEKNLVVHDARKDKKRVGVKEHRAMFAKGAEPKKSA